MARAKTGKASAAKPKKNTNGKAETKKKAKAAKPSAEQLSDQDRQALLFKHKNKVASIRAELKALKTRETSAIELAKKEGIPKKDIDLALKMDTDEGREAIELDLERTRRISRWMGFDKDLFGKPKLKDAGEHFEEGRRAALNDEPAKPPKHLGPKQAQDWLSGHAEGRTALNTERATGGFKPLGGVASGIAAKAAASVKAPNGANGEHKEGESATPPAIGTEPATFQTAA